MLLEDGAVAFGDLDDAVGLHADALIGERGVGTGHFEQRRFGGPERRRQVRLQRRLEAEAARVADDLGRRQLFHQLHGGNVARLLEDPAQRDGAFVLAVVVLRRVRRLAGPDVVRHGLVDNERRGRVSAIDRGGEDHGFERRADLTRGLDGAVELAAAEVEPADHGADLARPVVDGEQRAFHERRLLERDRDGAARFVYGGDFDLHEVADLHQVGRRCAARPLESVLREDALELADPHARRARRQAPAGLRGG